MEPLGQLDHLVQELAIRCVSYPNLPNTGKDVQVKFHPKMELDSIISIVGSGLAVLFTHAKKTEVLLPGIEEDEFIHAVSNSFFSNLERNSKGVSQ